MINEEHKITQHYFYMTSIVFYLYNIITYRYKKHVQKLTQLYCLNKFRKIFRLMLNLISLTKNLI